MSHQNNESNTNQNEESNEPTQELAEFYNVEFDGVDSVEQRGAQVADFGIPMNLNNISVKRNDEFESISDEVTRNIATLDISPLSETVNCLIPPTSEFELGATFQPSGSLFAQTYDNVNTDIAPPLPFFLQPARTSFRKQCELSTLRSDLETAFSKCSMSFSRLEHGYGYSCCALRQLTVVNIDVHIFCAESDLLVELRQVSGCRYAFSEVSEILAQALQVSYVEASTCLPPCPPLLSEEEMSALPELKRGMSCEVKCNEQVCTCEYAMQLISKGVSRSTLLQGLRAIGSLVDTLASAMSSCSHCGACGAHHYNHDQLFAKNGHWVHLAERVGELAKDDDEEVRTVAMAAVANIATLEHVCGKWLEKTIPTLVAGAQDEMPHVRREALRTIEAIASKDEKLAAKLVRAGVVPALELEANGGEDDQSPDDNMQSFAEGALQACRKTP